MKRRILFLHELLNLRREEMLSRVFSKMVGDSLKNDWILSLKENLNELNFEENLTSITMQKYLDSEIILINRKKIIFKARTKMLKVEHNYRNKKECPLCHNGNDE